MCGIVGIWSPRLRAEQARSALDQALVRLQHRGPDDRGIWLGPAGLALGHARLSILDLSEAGHQPMISKDGRHAVVFNGEVYNFAEIRERLRARGHSFVGSGDTEVVLKAFVEWGPDAVHQFIGMFAIGYWDEIRRTLELTRDRMGVKPLYYSWDCGELRFASELKAFAALGQRSLQVDTHSLGEFLQYGYISEDRTIYRGVHKLRPGHRLTVREGEPPVVTRYWSARDVIGQPLEGSDLEIEQGLEDLLIDAFKYRMVADVPVGVYLSGGIDSSLVTAILARHFDQQVRTFTIGFREQGYDESNLAREVAAHCGTRHEQYILGQSEALEIAKGWGGLFDEPFGDSSGIPTLLVSRRAAQEVKVVLSADGGDELFSGYESYRSVLSRLLDLHRVPTGLRKAAASGLSAVVPDRLNELLRLFSLSAPVRNDVVDKLYRWQAMLQRPTAGKLFDLTISHWRPDVLRQLVGGYEPQRASADSYPGVPDQQIALWDLDHYLPEDILTKVDRMTMAVSIEGREPLLDHRIVEYAFRLPVHLRRGTLGPKHILKNILYRYVPRQLVDRPKRGFGIPLEHWLRGELGELVDQYLAESRIRGGGLMDWKIVERLIADFRAGDDARATQLWYLLAFEMWREVWL